MNYLILFLARKLQVYYNKTQMYIYSQTMNELISHFSNSNFFHSLMAMVYRGCGRHLLFVIILRSLGDRHFFDGAQLAEVIAPIAKIKDEIGSWKENGTIFIHLFRRDLLHLMPDSITTTANPVMSALMFGVGTLIASASALVSFPVNLCRRHSEQWRWMATAKTLMIHRIR